MEQPDNMQEIEAAQTALGQFLVSMMPVPWERICFYADCAPGTSSVWYAVVERETDMIITNGSFWRRYESYPVSKEAATEKLPDLALDLYYAYAAKVGQDQVWKTMYYTLQSDGNVQIDFAYELPLGNLVEQQNAVYRSFFNCERKKSPKGKYPATE